MNYLSTTPTDISITPRNRRYDFKQALAGDWHGGDVFKTALFNAASLISPIAEAKLVGKFENIEDKIADKKLISEIKNLIAQESYHSRDHARMNKIICEARGYNLEDLLAPARRCFFSDPKNRHRIILRMATGFCFEHVIATISTAAFENDVVLDGADPAIADFWRWHFYEELEHKAVVLDAFYAIGGKRRHLILPLLIAPYKLFSVIFKTTHLILKYQNQPKFGIWMRGLWFLLGHPGIVRKMIPDYFAAFKLGYRPWQSDSRRILHHAKPTNFSEYE